MKQFPEFRLREYVFSNTEHVHIRHCIKKVPQNIVRDTFKISNRNQKQQLLILKSG